MQAAKQGRDASIKSRLRKLVLVPTAALVAMWLAVSGFLGYNAVMQYAMASIIEDLLTPSAVSLTDVMDERSASIAYLEMPDEQREELTTAREASDASMETFLDEFAKVVGYTSPDIQRHLNDLEQRFDGIDGMRAKVDAGKASRADVLEYYNGLIGSGTTLFDEQNQAITSTVVMEPGFRAVLMFRVVDTVARSDAQISRGLATGDLTQSDQQEFARLVGSYQGMLGPLRGTMTPEQDKRLVALLDGPEYAKLQTLERKIIDRDKSDEVDPATGVAPSTVDMPVEIEEWREALAPVKDELTEIGAEQALDCGEAQVMVANRAILTAIGGSLAVALVSVLAFVFALRSSRFLVDRLHKLRDETQELADHRLPDIVERLGRNETVCVASEVPQVTDSSDEIGEVARSFNAAQRTAVAAAVRQAELRDGVNKVFLNIAHRSHTLVHRQLRLLDRLENEQEDPAQLTELFKLDHLATRSRRNAENLLILGGETPGRTWHRPMPLIDVLRGAISESGDYTRVKRQQIADVSLNGPAVADVIHLVAELVDNATAFSPPHTQVHLRSELLPNGVSIEIEDRGLGMKDTDFEAANKLLADPPEFDVMGLNEKLRLGLFVVSRLAHRLNIKVRLRSSPYGGVQAIVMMPLSLIADGSASAPLSGAEGNGRAGQGRDGNGNGSSVGAGSGGNGTGTGTESRILRRLDRSENGAEHDVLLAPADEDERAEEFGETRFGGDMLASGGSPRYRRESGAGAGAESRPESGSGAGSAPDAAPGGDPARSTTVGSDREESAPAPASAPHTALTPPTGLDAGDADPSPAPTTLADGRPKLPKRLPQAHMAPQLYDSEPVPEFRHGGGTLAEDEAARSQRLRENMAAFQQGTQRGRRDGRKRTGTADADREATESTEKDAPA